MVNEDLSVDDESAPAQADGELAKQFLHPGYTWRGLSLRPYTGGTDSIFDQIFDVNDAAMTSFLAFIFVHLPIHYYKTEKGETAPTPEFSRTCWDKSKFREAFFIWRESIGPLSTEDRTSAIAVVEEMRGWARKSSVEVIPDDSLPQKKTKAKRQPA